MELRFISVATGEDVSEPRRQKVEAKPTDTTEVLSGETPEKEPTVLAARLLDADGRVLSRECDWPQPLKHMTFPDRGLKVEQNGERITFNTHRPIKALTFQNPDVHWEDNCIDLMPGDEQQISAGGFTEKIEWLYYGI